jgi:hypothetical protein
MKKALVAALMMLGSAAAATEIPVVVLGLWISADGDDTGSSFNLSIERITLNTE